MLVMGIDSFFVVSYKMNGIREAPTVDPGITRML